MLAGAMVGVALDAAGCEEQSAEVSLGRYNGARGHVSHRQHQG